MSDKACEASAASQTRRVGCFEVTELTPGRWRVVNTLTTFEHVTYGTEEDVRAGLETQALYWEKRFADLGTKKPGKRMQDRTLAPVKKSPFIESRGIEGRAIESRSIEGQGRGRGDPNAKPSDKSTEPKNTGLT